MDRTHRLYEYFVWHCCEKPFIQLYLLQTQFITFYRWVSNFSTFSYWTITQKAYLKNRFLSANIYFYICIFRFLFVAVNLSMSIRTLCNLLSHNSKERWLKWTSNNFCKKAYIFLLTVPENSYSFVSSNYWHIRTSQGIHVVFSVRTLNIVL